MSKITSLCDAIKWRRDQLVKTDIQSNKKEDVLEDEDDDWD